MHMTEDLSRLKELDPNTWNKYDGLELAKYNNYDDYGKITDYIYAEDLIDVAQTAWLQYCLQEAIAAKGWYWAVSNDNEWSGKYWGTICLLAHESGDSPAAALLAAYVAALEGQE